MSRQRIVRQLRKFIAAMKLHGLITAIAASVMKFTPAQRIWHRLFGRPIRLIDVMRLKMHVDLSDPGISWQLITRGRREVDHVNDIRNNLRPGMRGIDLGAHIGYFALI